jgi:uncharacterized protein YrrD
MRKISELIGKAIVSADSGQRLGRVSDVLLDADARSALGLVVSDGVLSGEQVLPLAEVQTLGTDAVVARSASHVVAAREWRQRDVAAIRSSAVKHKPVLTGRGRALGEVHDVLLDDDGRVLGFELVSSSMGGLRHQYSTVPYASGLTVGADAVVVPDEAAPPVD